MQPNHRCLPALLTYAGTHSLDRDTGSHPLLKGPCFLSEDPDSEITKSMLRRNVSTSLRFAAVKLYDAVPLRML